MSWLVSREDHESNAHAVSLPHHVGVEPLPIAAFEKIDAFLTGSADLNEGSVAKAGTDGIDVCKRGLQKLSSLVEEKSSSEDVLEKTRAAMANLETAVASFDRRMQSSNGSLAGHSLKLSNVLLSEAKRLYTKSHDLGIVEHFCEDEEAEQLTQLAGYSDVAEIDLKIEALGDLVGRLGEGFSHLADTLSSNGSHGHDE
jgi:hypothetical protein